MKKILSLLLIITCVQCKAQDMNDLVRATLKLTESQEDDILTQGGWTYKSFTRDSLENERVTVYTLGESNDGTMRARIEIIAGSDSSIHLMVLTHYSDEMFKANVTQMSEMRYSNIETIKGDSFLIKVYVKDDIAIIAESWNTGAGLNTYTLWGSNRDYYEKRLLQKIEKVKRTVDNTK